MKLNELRKEIDAIDDQLAQLLVKRLRIAQRNGLVKKEVLFIQACDSEREAIVRERISQNTDDPEIKNHLLKIYEEIMNESKAVQNKIIKNKNF